MVALSAELIHSAEKRLPGDLPGPQIWRLFNLEIFSRFFLGRHFDFFHQRSEELPDFRAMDDSPVEAGYSQLEFLLHRLKRFLLPRHFI